MREQAIGNDSVHDLVRGTGTFDRAGRFLFVPVDRTFFYQSIFSLAGENILHIYDDFAACVGYEEIFKK